MIFEIIPFKSVRGKYFGGMGIGVRWAKPNVR
jgi:hypothetical protein